nr:MAG TPA: hypothetical protein [Bacteriophage sp.]
MLSFLFPLSFLNSVRKKNMLLRVEFERMGVIKNISRV